MIGLVDSEEEGEIAEGLFHVVDLPLRGLPTPEGLPVLKVGLLVNPEVPQGAKLTSGHASALLKMVLHCSN